MWDVTSGQSVGEPLRGHDSGVTSVASGHIEDHDIIITGSFDRTLRVWDVAARRIVAVLDVFGPVTSVALSVGPFAGEGNDLSCQRRQTVHGHHSLNLDNA
jgi:WD40 repeat protein